MRTNPAYRDQNDNPVALGVSSVDLVTPLMFNVDPVTGWLLVENSTDSLTPTSASRDKRDQNNRATMYGISSADNITLIPIRTDSNGKLLIQYT